MENKELFNNKTKKQPAQRQPMQLGLYDVTNEHDACGVGMLVNIHATCLKIRPYKLISYAEF